MIAASAFPHESRGWGASAAVSNLNGINHGRLSPQSTIFPLTVEHTPWSAGPTVLRVAFHGLVTLDLLEIAIELPTFGLRQSANDGFHIVGLPLRVEPAYDTNGRDDADDPTHSFTCPPHRQGSYSAPDFPGQ